MRKSTELKENEIMTQDDLEEPLDYAYIKLEILNEGLWRKDAAREELGETYENTDPFSVRSGL